MTNPFVAVHRAVWRSVSDSVRSIRRQAPGARMIGEFAVKHVVNEAGKKLSSGTHPASPTQKVDEATRNTSSGNEPSGDEPAE